jgi:hypothetical protein
MIGSYKRINKDELDLLLKRIRTVFDVTDSEDEESLGKFLDIDKSWHAIHFLLNNDAWDGDYPLHNAVLGGTEIGEDLGYGAAHYLTPEEVQETSNALSQISEQRFLSRFDADKLNKAEIYPQGWRGDKQEVEYLRGNFLDLVGFFKEAANADEAMVIWLS